MMSVKKKSLIIIVSIVTVVVLFVMQPIFQFGMFYYADKWEAAVNDFGKYEKSFLTLADYAIKHFESGYGKTLSVTRCGEEKRLTLFDTELQYISLDEKTQLALNEANEAFSHPDYTLYLIHRIDEKIYFHSQNGRYALVYSPADKRPRRLLGKNIRTPISVKKIKRNWYHVVSR